jgi:hypothetical protein
MTPIIETHINGPLDFLVKEGHISVHDPKSSLWTKLNPFSIASGGLNTAYDVISWPYRTIGDWWYGNDSSPIENLYDFAEINAPKVGKFIANGLETSYKGATEFTRLPSAVIQAISEATGLPYNAVLLGACTIGGLAYYGLTSGWHNVTVNQSTKVDTKVDANANGNKMVINLYPPPNNKNDTENSKQIIIPLGITNQNPNDKKIDKKIDKK